MEPTQRARDASAGGLGSLSRHLQLWAVRLHQLRLGPDHGHPGVGSAHTLNSCASPLARLILRTQKLTFFRSINYCVRWESSTPVTEAERAQVATVVAEQYNLWFEWLYGFDNFPFSSIDVNVVGWAVTDESLLQGSTDGIDVYTNTDSEGAPECLPACGRFFNQDGDYSGCPGGAERHYDQSLWMTDGFGGGAGGDWGQRMGREYLMGALGSEQIQILLHEMGHTFGLDDFYDWTPTGVTNFIMLAGSSATITDFDGWMLRNWWYELSRNRGW